MGDYAQSRNWFGAEALDRFPALFDCFVGLTADQFVVLIH